MNAGGLSYRSICRDGEIGRRTGLKILRELKSPCRFKSGSRQFEFLFFNSTASLFLDPSRSSM